MNQPLSALWDTLELRPYLGALNDRHSIVDSLALPNMRDMSPLRIRQLFVNPQLAENYASASSNPKSWPEGMGLFAALEKWRQIVVLGDPGAGKTTLSNWLAWRLSAGLVAKLPEALDDRLPICCVLREMPAHLFADNTEIIDLVLWSARRLLAGKLENLTEQSLRNWVKAGRYVLILDGADEIAPSHAPHVQRWLQRCFEDDAVMLATSRIVGYDDAPLHCATQASGPGAAMLNWSEMEPVLKRAYAKRSEKTWQKITSGESPLALENIAQESLPNDWAQRLYLLPFDDQRIASFASNWYQQRSASELDANEKTADLLHAIKQSTATQELARTPNLLSLMAIVHRERAHLPNGKALLYKEIANAYINTIDQQRKISPGDVLVNYSPEVRESWLAYVAFHMQKLRFEEGEQGDTGVLVEKEKIEQWLAEAMAKSNLPDAASHAREFLHWVARRSGLLLPRSETMYAFVHLSFQEYFSARFLLAQITSPGFIRGKYSAVSEADLRAWTRYSLWQETLLYVLELLSTERADWLEFALECLFGDCAETKFDDGTQAELALRVVNDQHISCDELWQRHLAHAAAIALPIFIENMGDGLAVAGYALRIREQVSEGKPSASLLASLTQADKILCVNARGSALADLGFLQPMQQLRYLDVDHTPVANLQPLAQLSALQHLSLVDSKVQDIRPLQGLHKLQFLNLSDTRVAELAPLAGLQQLHRLHLSGLDIDNIDALAALTALDYLSLSRTKVSDLSALAHLHQLSLLNLSASAVTELSSVAKLPKLEYLYLYNTPITSCLALAEAPALRFLQLSKSQRVLGEDLKRLRPKLTIHYT